MDGHQSKAVELMLRQYRLTLEEEFRVRFESFDFLLTKVRRYIRLYLEELLAEDDSSKELWLVEKVTQFFCNCLETVVGYLFTTDLSKVYLRLSSPEKKDCLVLLPLVTQKSALSLVQTSHRLLLNCSGRRAAEKNKISNFCRNALC